MLLTPFLSIGQKTVNYRQEISLNDSLEIAKTNSLKEMPSAFLAKIPVVGLVDLVKPEIEKQDSAYNNSIYWYKRTFTVENLKVDVIQLKINMANYYTWVNVNRKLVGENVYNFTPSVFNVKPFLNKGNIENELIIAVGCWNNLPDTVTNSCDFEKTKYIPGIYDDVKLILSGYPFIFNIQTVQDIKNKQLRVAEIQTNNATRKTEVSYLVRETISKKVIAH